MRLQPGPALGACSPGEGRCSGNSVLNDEQWSPSLLAEPHISRKIKDMGRGVLWWSSG